MQKKIEYEENSDLSVSSNESDNDHELTKKFEKDYALIKKMRKDVWKNFENLLTFNT